MPNVSIEKKNLIFIISNHFHMHYTVVLFLLLLMLFGLSPISFYIKIKQTDHCINQSSVCYSCMTFFELSTVIQLKLTELEQNG